MFDFSLYRMYPIFERKIFLLSDGYDKAEAKLSIICGSIKKFDRFDDYQYWGFDRLV